MRSRDGAGAEHEALATETEALPPSDPRNNLDALSIEGLNLPDFSKAGPEEAGPSDFDLPDFSVENKLPPKVQILHAPLSNLLRILSGLRLSRHEAGRVRAELDFLQSTSQYKFEYLLDSHRQILHADQQSTIPLDAAETERMTNQLLKDHGECDRTVKSIRMLEQDLGRQEYSMKCHEENLASVTSELIDIVERLEILDSLELHHLTAPETAAETILPRSTTPQFPAVVQEYFDKFADINIMQERQDALEADHREELLNRQLREDQGQSLNISDQVFVASYKENRAAAIRAVDDAKAIAARAYDACMEAGLDPNKILQNLAQPVLPDSDMTSSLSELQAVERELHSITATSPSSVGDIQQPEDQVLKHAESANNSGKRLRRSKKRGATKIRKWQLDLEEAGDMHDPALDTLWDINPRANLHRKSRSLEQIGDIPKGVARATRLYEPAAPEQQTNDLTDIAPKVRPRAYTSWHAPTMPP